MHAHAWTCHQPSSFTISRVSLLCNGGVMTRHSEQCSGLITLCPVLGLHGLCICAAEGFEILESSRERRLVNQAHYFTMLRTTLVKIHARTCRGLLSLQLCRLDCGLRESL